MSRAIIRRFPGTRELPRESVESPRNPSEGPAATTARDSKGRPGPVTAATVFRIRKLCSSLHSVIKRETTAAGNRRVVHQGDLE